MLIKRRLKKTLTVFGQPIAAKQLYKIKPATNGSPKSLPKSQPPNAAKKSNPCLQKKVKVKKAAPEAPLSSEAKGA